MAQSLKSKTLHALSWSFLESIGEQGVRFVIGIMLARILFPEQFGLIGMLTIFMAVAQTFLDSGFGAALIQKREPSQTDICSIFYFNLLVGIAITGLLYLAAPWIADFYDQPILTPLTRLLSLTIPISSLGFIQSTLLTKQINFKTQTHISLIAGIASGAIGVMLAFKGFGVWSLAIQQIFSASVRTLSLWLWSSWRPALLFSFQSLQSMFSFGSRLLFSALLNQIFNNIYLLVIGKLFSAADLGFFTRAKSLEETPSQTLSQMVGRVSFPVFSTIQDDPARMKRGLQKALLYLSLANFPVMIGLAVIARPLVLLLLTEKWAESVSYFQLLCFSGLLYPMHLMNLNVLQALGRSELFLRLEICKKVLTIINIAITWRWGITAMIYGMIATSLISYYLNSLYTGILIGYPMREQLRDFIPYLIVSLLMGTAVYLMGYLPFSSYGTLLMGQVFMGTVIYAFLCWLFRLQAFMEVWKEGWNRGQILVSGISK